MTEFFQRLKTLGLKVKAEEPLSRHTTYGIGGPAEVFAEPVHTEQLRQIMLCAKEFGKSVFVLGNGSNVLVQDGGLRGVVVHLAGDFAKLTIEDCLVKAGAAVMMPVLVKKCAEAGLSGMEGWTGIPGSVGGGLVMNAGTKLGEIYDCVQTVTVMDLQGQQHLLDRSQIAVRYRHAELHGAIAIEATLKLTRGDKVAIMQKINSYMTYRAQTQPLGTMNVGSVFKNPPGDHAARLIESLGLKGHRIGGAQISPKHANFIVNIEGGAKAEDVKALIALARTSVKERYGIELEPEVKIVGEP